MFSNVRVRDAWDKERLLLKPVAFYSILAEKSCQAYSPTGASIQSRGAEIVIAKAAEQSPVQRNAGFHSSQRKGRGVTSG